jgi:O-antigen/teichoic acid export membrane protein
MNILNRTLTNDIFAKMGSNEQIIAKNIVFSAIIRGLRAVFNILQIPVLLNILSVADMGVWQLIFGMVSWLTFFDLGIAAGFRNKLIEVLALKDFGKARQLVSTAYISIGLLFGGLVLLFGLALFFFDIPLVFRQHSATSNLTVVYFVCAFFVALQLSAALFSQILTAYNKTANADLIVCISEFLVLLILLFFKYTSANISILAIAIVSTVIPFLVFLVANIYGFSTTYKHLVPSFARFDKSQVRTIANVGLQFFAIQLTSLVIYQSLQVFIGYRFGPEQVVAYSATYRYFSLSSLLFTSLTASFIPLLTHEYRLGNIAWIHSAKRKLYYIWAAICGILVIMVLCGNWLIPYIVDSKVKTVPLSFLVVMALWFMIHYLGAIYYFILSSMNALGLQVIASTIAAGLCIWLFFVLSNKYAITGVPLACCIVLSINAVLMYWQVKIKLK